MGSKSSIKLYLVCGFLGSGKTTFLKKFLSHIIHNGEKCGVLMNEFGKIGIDGKTLPQGTNMVELNNGSIFCQCLHGRFLEELVNYSHFESLDVLLIEASGMADPSSLFDDLSLLKEKSRVEYSAKAVICLIDSEYFLQLNEVILTIRKQVQASNIVIINKVDLVEKDVVESIKSTITKLNPKVSIYLSTHGDISFDDIFRAEDNFLAQPYNEIHSLDILNPKFLSINLESSMVIDRDQFKEFFSKIKEYAFRLKGFIQFQDGWYSVNGVKNTISLENSKDSYTKTEMVLIYQEEDKKEVIQLVNALWDNY